MVCCMLVFAYIHHGGGCIQEPMQCLVHLLRENLSCFGTWIHSVCMFYFKLSKLYTLVTPSQDAQCHHQNYFNRIK